MKPAIRTVSVVCALATIIAVATAPSTPALASDVATLVEGVPVSSAMFANCLDCSICGTNGHKALTGDETSVYGYGVGPHNCNEVGGCEPSHPIRTAGSCTSEPGGGEEGDEEAAALVIAELNSIRLAIRQGDLAGARRIAESGMKAIVYVPERNAVQALGCGGVVISHISLTAVNALE